MLVNYDERFDKYDGKVVMPCPPYGDALVRYHHGWLMGTYKRIVRQWPEYWVEIYKSTISTMKSYGESDNFGKMPFEIHINKSGGWIKDDVMFELIFTPGDDEISCGPFYVTAFSGLKVIHSQASY